jgi:hypothetical protein
MALKITPIYFQQQSCLWLQLHFSFKPQLVMTKLTVFLLSLTFVYVVMALQLEFNILNFTITSNTDYMTVSEWKSADGKSYQQTIVANKKLHELMVSLTCYTSSELLSPPFPLQATFTLKILRLKMTAVNETIDVCEKRMSNNVFVNYTLNFLAKNLDRKFECPLLGQYNLTLDFGSQKDAFNYVPPFMKTMKTSSLVVASFFVKVRENGAMVEVLRETGFVKVSMK